MPELESDPFALFMNTDLPEDTAIPVTELMEAHIFNSYLENTASDADVKAQFREFDFYKAINILILYGVKNNTAPSKVNDTLTRLYVQCNQFSNWNLDEGREQEEQLRREMNNISEETAVVFLLEIIRLRILYDHEIDLKLKQYALLMLNPSTSEGSLFRDAVFEDVEMSVGNN